MAVMVTIDYQQVPVADYDAMQPSLEPEFRVADGFIAHIAYLDDHRLSVIEIWESRAAFETWMADTIVPMMEGAGGSEPEYVVHDVHNLLVAE